MPSRVSLIRTYAFAMKAPKETSLFTGWPRVGRKIDYECEKSKLIRSHIGVTKISHLIAVKSNLIFETIFL